MFILFILLSALVALGALLYNRLIRDRNRVDGAWSDIDVQLQRRHDLIPQLVKAVDQYADYERATIEAVTALRAEAMNMTSVTKLGEAEEELSQGLPLNVLHGIPRRSVFDAGRVNRNDLRVTELGGDLRLAQEAGR